MSKPFNIRADHVLTIAIHVPVYPFSQIIEWLTDFQLRPTPMIINPICTQKSSKDFLSDSSLKPLSSVCSPQLWQRFGFAVSLKRNASCIALVGTGVRDTASCVSYFYVALLPFAFWCVSRVLFADFNSTSNCLLSQKPIATRSHILKLMPYSWRLVSNLSL